MAKQPQKKVRIKMTHIPFWPKPSANGEDVITELYEKILECSERWGKDKQDFSAKFELLPTLRGGHFLLSEVTYLKGSLPTPKKRK